MEENPLLECRNIGKRFCRDFKRSLMYGAADICRELCLQSQDSLRLRTEEFWALQKISFKVRRGECIGLLGRNGAGKTTLLRILNGLIKPDRGEARVRGRVGAMIALGAGFNPILTGRENLYVNAAVLGISKREIDKRFDEIVAFAELEAFIDSPVRSYSSGMQIRLGFSIATAFAPDVLLLDEVLAVGDARFRSKCYNRVATLIENAAVVYVGHDTNQIGRFCNRVIVLQRGQIVHDGDTAAGIRKYHEGESGALVCNQSSITIFDDSVSDVRVSLTKSSIQCGEEVAIEVNYSAKREIRIGDLRCNLVDQYNQLVADLYSNPRIKQYVLYQGVHTLMIDLGRINLAPGDYYLNISIAGESGVKTLLHATYISELEVISDAITTAPVLLGIVP